MNSKHILVSLLAMMSLSSAIAVADCQPETRRITGEEARDLESALIFAGVTASHFPHHMIYGLYVPAVICDESYEAYDSQLPHYYCEGVTATRDGAETALLFRALENAGVWIEGGMSQGRIQAGQIYCKSGDDVRDGGRFEGNLCQLTAVFADSCSP